MKNTLPRTLERLEKHDSMMTRRYRGTLASLFDLPKHSPPGTGVSIGQAG